MTRSSQHRRKPTADTTTSTWTAPAEQQQTRPPNPAPAPAQSASPTAGEQAQVQAQPTSFGHSFANISLFPPARDTASAPPDAPAGPTVQASLRVSAPGDVYEQEADRMADLVMRSPAGPDEQAEPSRAPDMPSYYVQRAPSGAGLGVSPEVEGSIGQMRGGGQPLPAGERTFFERRFGHDFSSIRIHADNHAAQTSRALNARAFTVGTDIAFDSGEYQPGTESGRHLLAHELTHTIQQTGGVATKRLQRKPSDEDKAPAPAGVSADGQNQAAEPEAPAAQAPAASAAAPARAESPAPAPAAPASAEAAPAAPASSAAPAAPAPAAAPAAAPVLSGAGAESAASPTGEAAPAVASGEAQAEQTRAEAKRAHALAQQLAQGGLWADGHLTRSEETIQRAPRSPEADPDFLRVTGAIKTTATEQKQHAPPQQKADEAAAAAKMPAEERQGQAQNTQTTTVQAAAEAQADKAKGGQAPGFDKATFVAAVKQRIVELTPKDPRQMEDIEGSGVFTGTKSAVDEKVGTGKQQAQGPVGDKLKEAPDTSAVPDKPVTPLKPNAPGQPPSLDASAATPKPHDTAEVETPLLTESQALDTQMAEAQVTPEQLQSSNEPTFQGALEAKTSAQTKVAADLPAYRATEQGQISGAQQEARTQGNTGVQGMGASRTQLFGEMDTLQGTGKTGDEQKRQEIGREIDRIYTATKGDVERILSELDTAVDSAFNSGAERAKQCAVDYIKRETQAYKDRRYASDKSLLDVGAQVEGLWNRGSDFFTDMPAEYYEYYNKGRDLYLAEMETVLSDVADIVGDHLGRARARVGEGRTQIQKYVESLPQELRGIAEQTAGEAQSKFTTLEQQVDSKQQELVNTLAERYTTKLSEMDATLATMKEADKGLLAKAKDLMTGVLGKIGELKALLEGVLAQAAGVVMQILANPMQFVSNLISGVGQGLQSFVANIGTHLQAGFIEWLTGTIGGAGIQIPQTLDLQGIFTLAMQVLGMSYENLRARAVAMFGDGVVGALEQCFEVVNIIATEGVAGLWQWVQDQFSNIKEMVLDGIKEMLIGEVIEAGIKWLVGILGGPAGAFIKACMAIYDIVMWFVNNGSRLMDLVQSVIGAAGAIASGDVGGAAKAVEQALARAVPATIGFLASLLGLGDLGAKVRKIVERVQEPINKAIDFVLGLVKGFVQKIAKLLGFGKDGKGGKGDGEIGKKVTFSTEEEHHELWVKDEGATAAVWMASANPQRVDEHLNFYLNNLSKLPQEKEPEALGLIDQAMGLTGPINSKASEIKGTVSQVMKPEDADKANAADQKIEAEEETLAGVMAKLAKLFENPLDKQLKELGPDRFMKQVAERTWNFARNAHTQARLSPESMEILLEHRATEAGTSSNLAKEVADKTVEHVEKQFEVVQKKFAKKFDGRVQLETKTPKRVQLFSAGSEKLTSDIDYQIQGDGSEHAVKLYNDMFRAKFERESGTYFDVNVYAKGFVPDPSDPSDELKNVEGEVIYDDSSVHAYTTMIRQMHKGEWERFKTQVKEGLSESLTQKVDGFFTRAEKDFATYVRTLATELGAEIKEGTEDIDELHGKIDSIRQTLIDKSEQAGKDSDIAKADADDAMLKANNAIYQRKLSELEKLRTDLLALVEAKNKADQLLTDLRNGEDIPEKFTIDELEKKAEEIEESIKSQKIAIRQKIEETYAFANEAYVTKASVTAVVVKDQMKGENLDKTTPNTKSEEMDAFNEQASMAMHGLHVIAAEEPVTAKPQKYVERMVTRLGSIDIPDSEGKILAQEFKTAADGYNSGKPPRREDVQALRELLLDWTARKMNSYYRQGDGPKN
jgi:hypothetical protein